MKIEIRPASPEERSSAASWPLWTGEAGSFEWGYAETETSLILEGEAMVEALGKEYYFKAGDWVVLPKGLACRWHIRQAVRKHHTFG